MKKSRLFRRSTLIVSIIALAVALTVGVIAGVAMLSNEQEQTAVIEYGEQCSNIQVSTSGAVSLKFYYTTYGTADQFVVEIVDPNNADAVDVKGYSVDSLKETKDGYCLSVPLTPAQMMHTVKVYPADASGANRGEPMVYSVKQYATEVLANDKYADYHDAMRSLLNWGATAQVRFVEEGKEIGTLASTGVFARNTNPINALSSISYTKNTVTADSVFSNPVMFVSLEPGNLAVHIYVDYSGNGTLSATVSKDGEKAVDTDVASTSKGYRLRLANVPATRFDTP